MVTASILSLPHPGNVQKRRTDSGELTASEPGVFQRMRYSSARVERGGCRRAMQPPGSISASGEVGLKKREDLRGAEQSPHDAGVSPSCPVVDKPKTLRKLPMCPAPAMLFGVSYHCR
jgi:hypothetical protein